MLWGPLPADAQVSVQDSPARGVPECPVKAKSDTDKGAERTLSVNCVATLSVSQAAAPGSRSLALQALAPTQCAKIADKVRRDPSLKKTYDRLLSACVKAGSLSATDLSHGNTGLKIDDVPAKGIPPR